MSLALDEERAAARAVRDAEVAFEREVRRYVRDGYGFRALRDALNALDAARAELAAKGRAR